MLHALIALNRFGLGARIGEQRTVRNPKAWLEGQLRAKDALLDDSKLPRTKEIDEVFRNLQQAQRGQDQAATRQARRALQRLLQTESAAALTRRITTDSPFLERLVAFWSNHLCVSVSAKQPLIGLAGAYERQAIRPHVLGKFEDLVLASAKHPAMLVYLDNLQSIGPGSPGARRLSRRGGERGLNENYARELLELHTLGVDGGYEQADVEALARVLTGWTVSGIGPRSDEPREFIFRRGIHEPGSKTVLGKRYRGGGVGEGEAVIRDLCAHPSTANFIATKLVRHFVSDDPPTSAVDTIAGVFEKSGGDLLEVSRALVHLDEAWAPEARKFRTPQDWVVAALRAIHLKELPEPAPQLLRQLRHPLWAPRSPKGYSDTTNDWADPDALMNRAELGRTMATRFGEGRLDPARFLEVVHVDSADPLRDFVADTHIGPDERIALVLGGPAFQWR